MRIDKKIAIKLKEKGIEEFKIVRSVSCGIVYRLCYGNKKINDLFEDSILVIIVISGKVIRFSISSDINEVFLEKIIDKIIQENSEYAVRTKCKWDIKNIKRDSSCNKYIFEDYNVKRYEQWIDEEIKKLMQDITFPFNIVYTMNSAKYSVLTDKSYCEQYHSESEFLCMKNIKFEKKAIVKNVFFDNLFVSAVVEKLNKKPYIYKEIKMEEDSYIVIKAKAMEALLNEYIKLFYANYIYTGQSLFQMEDMGKYISKCDFDLIELPYENMLFDGEGEVVRSKLIISSGKMVNILGNLEYSKYLGGDYCGNADLKMEHLVTHQRLKFKIRREPEYGIKQNMTIYEAKQLSINFNDHMVYANVIYGEKNKRYTSMIKLDLNYLFDNLYATNQVYEWIQNVYCCDTVLYYEK